jgi:hypothetical protein
LKACVSAGSSDNFVVILFQDNFSGADEIWIIVNNKNFGHETLLQTGIGG